MSYRTEKLVTDAHTNTHTNTQTMATTIYGDPNWPLVKTYLHISQYLGPGILLLGNSSFSNSKASLLCSRVIHVFTRPMNMILKTVTPEFPHMNIEEEFPDLKNSRFPKFRKLEFFISKNLVLLSKKKKKIQCQMKNHFATSEISLNF